MQFLVLIVIGLTGASAFANPVTCDGYTAETARGLVTIQTQMVGQIGYFSGFTHVTGAVDVRCDIGFFDDDPSVCHIKVKNVTRIQADCSDI